MYNVLMQNEDLIYISLSAVRLNNQHMFLSRSYDITYKNNLKLIHFFLIGTPAFVRLLRKRFCEYYSPIGHPALKNPYKHILLISPTNYHHNEQQVTSAKKTR